MRPGPGSPTASTATTIKPAERAEHGTDVIVYLKDDTADESFGTFAQRARAHAAHQALQQLRALSYQDGSDEEPQGGGPRAGRGRPAGRAAVGELHRGGDHQLHGPHLEAQASPRSPRRSTTSSTRPTSTTSKTRPALSPCTRKASLNYDALMFVPSRAPWDMYSKDYKRGPRPVHLQRAHHGQVRGASARLLRLRARRG